MKLSIVILTLNQVGYLQSIINQIESQTVMPHEVIIINNGSTDETKDFLNDWGDEGHSHFNLRIIHEDENTGVNPAWNKGFQLATGDLVGIWNDDINIPPEFVETLCREFENESQWGILIPNTVTDSEDFPGVTIKGPTVPYRGRQGWAFTVRKKPFERIFPIPSQFKIWFGDDYLFLMCQLHNMEIGQLTGVRISHFGSKTTIALHGTAREAQLPFAAAERHAWTVFVNMLRDKGFIK